MKIHQRPKAVLSGESDESLTRFTESDATIRVYTVVDLTENSEFNDFIQLAAVRIEANGRLCIGMHSLREKKKP